jgi:CheY-like chemotaxis protein
MVDFLALAGGNYILVLDDEPDIVTVITRSLRRQGLDVREFTDPVAAIEDFRQNFNDCLLILSDIRMPRMNGFQFVKMARQIRPGARVVFMTSFEINISEFEKIHPSVKVDDLLKKPVLMRKLEALIRDSMAATATMETKVKS